MFDDFVSFVNTEAGNATDPVFLGEALRRLDGSSDRPNLTTKAEVRGRLKLMGTDLVLRITSPIMQLM